jgi:hypothetical protein
LQKCLFLGHPKTNVINDLKNRSTILKAVEHDVDGWFTKQCVVVKETTHHEKGLLKYTR